MLSLTWLDLTFMAWYNCQSRSPYKCITLSQCVHVCLVVWHTVVKPQQSIISVSDPGRLWVLWETPEATTVAVIHPSVNVDKWRCSDSQSVSDVLSSGKCGVRWSCYTVKASFSPLPGFTGAKSPLCGERGFKAPTERGSQPQTDRETWLFHTPCHFLCLITPFVRNQKTPLNRNLFVFPMFF